MFHFSLPETTTEMYGMRLPTGLDLAMEALEGPSFRIRTDAEEAVSFAAMIMKTLYDQKRTPVLNQDSGSQFICCHTEGKDDEFSHECSSLFLR